MPANPQSNNLQATETYFSPGLSVAALLHTPITQTAAGILNAPEVTVPSPQATETATSSPTTEAATPAAEKPAETAPAQPAVALLPNIPLDAATQQRIFNESCESNKQLFALMMAIANRESDFRAKLIGDNGISYGIVQINTRWHMDRLHKLGITKDQLFDPVKCILVGADYIKELAADQNNFSVTHSLLMSYNQGPGSAQKSIRSGVTSSDYSREVMGNYELYLSMLK